MKNSICLPLPTSENSPVVLARCFVVFESHSREVVAYPFTLRSIREMNEARHYETVQGPQVMEWCATLFFPECWPPELIECYLRSRSFQPSLFE